MSLSGKDAIHVTLGVHDPEGTYSRHAGVVMVSMFERTRSTVCVHILHDNTLSSDNRAMFIETAEIYGQTIEFHDVSPSMLKWGDSALRAARKSIFTVGMFFRLMIPELVTSDKVIYLDSDIMVNMDIKQLWDVPLENFSIAGVVYGSFRKFSPKTLSLRLLGCDPSKYVNSGVLVMNLSRIRAKYNLPAEGNEWVKKWAYLSSMLDQDFINARFRGDILFIDGKFNRGLYCSDITDTIIHASGSPKPWDSPEGTAAESLYWKSYLKTAWALREGREKTVDLIMEAVRNSTWTHRHTANCCRNILSRLKKEVLTNNYAVRILTLPAKYLYCRVGNRTAGIEK